MEENQGTTTEQTPVQTGEQMTTGQSGQEGFSSSEDIEKILSFDPFKPEGSNEGVTAPETKVDEKVDEGEGATPTSQPPKKDALESPTVNPELELMKQQLKEASDALAQMKAMREEKPAQGEEPKETTPSYVFNVPDQLVDMLASEDAAERKAGITALLAGASRNVHKTVLDTVYHQVAPAIVQMITQQASQQAEMQKIHADFYGTYPEFNKPEIIPHVQQAAKQLAAEMKVQGYSATFRDALALRLRGLFGTAPLQTPAPAPKINSGKNARVNPTPVQKEQQEMLEMLSNF